MRVVGRYERELRKRLRFDLNQIVMTGFRDTESLAVLFAHLATSRIFAWLVIVLWYLKVVWTSRMGW